MITDRQYDLELARKAATVSAIVRINNSLSSQGISLDPTIVGNHPLAGLIYNIAIRGGSAEKDQLIRINSLLLKRYQSDSEKIYSGKVFSIQSPLVLPAQETRNALLLPTLKEEISINKQIEHRFNSVKDKMPSWWHSFVQIISSYTEVNINQTDDHPRFSGSYSIAPGAIHGVSLSDDDLFIEIITHEAGHLWLNLLASADRNFIQNPYEDAFFVSPWRNDPRPIHGIFHGAYVFSIVVPALYAWGSGTAHSRVQALIVEVHDAILQIRRFAKLSREAIQIMDAAEGRVKRVEALLENENLVAMRRNYEFLKANRVIRQKAQSKLVQVV